MTAGLRLVRGDLWLMPESWRRPSELNQQACYLRVSNRCQCGYSTVRRTSRTVASRLLKVAGFCRGRSIDGGAPMAHVQLSTTSRAIASRRRVWVLTASGLAVVLAAALASPARADVSPECATLAAQGGWSYRCLQEQQGLTPGAGVGDNDLRPPPDSVGSPPPDSAWPQTAPWS